MENILIFGYGNIAKRHIENIKLINPKINFSIFTKNYFKHKSQKKIKIIKNFKDLDLSLFKTILICSPANTHLKYLKYFIKKKAKVFIEKPLDTNLKLAKNIYNLCGSFRCDIKVGYVFRHNKLAKKIKYLLQKNKIGKIKEVEILSSSYLPDWRKNKDYKKSVSAVKKLGGGVLLELSHEIDYLFWFFGKPQSFESKLHYSKKIKTNVETGVDIKMIFKKGFNVNMKLDFHSKNKNERFCKIIGSKKSLFWKINQKKLLINHKDKKVAKTFKDKSDMYFDQMFYFIKKKKIQNSLKKELSNSIDILKFIRGVKLGKSKI